MDNMQHHHVESVTAEILETVETIPPLPLIVTYVLELTSNDDVSTVSLAHALEADPGLTAKILRISNSAFYAPVERVYTVRDAIKFVGFETVRSLAVTSTMMNRIWVDDESFSRQMFWRHSLRCGLFARAIASRLKTMPADILFTIGVLHDIGRAALIQHDAVLYRSVIELSKSKNMYLWQAEMELLGINHAELGGQLAMKWKLPHSYSEAVAWHHEPERGGEFRLLAHVIMLADALAHSVSSKDRLGLMTPPLVRDLWEPLGLDQASVQSIYSLHEAIEEHTRSLFETASLG